MANVIKPKRSNTAAKVPNTSELLSGELGVNMADKKVYINNGTSIIQVGAGVLSALGDVSISSPTNGQSLSWNGTAWVNSTGSGSGTVTSVTGTAPVSVATGTTTPVISMAAATASVNGYMTSTYASKLDGIAAGATNVTNTNQLTNGAGFITSAGTSAACSGNSATATLATNATSAYSIDNISFKNSDSTSIFAVDTEGVNGIGYSNGYTLFGQTDGAVYCSTYNASWQHQINGDFRTGQIAIRGKNSGTWQAWRVVLDSSNYTSYAPSLTGSGASGTWGINVTGTAGSAPANGGTATALSSSNYISQKGSTGSWNADFQNTPAGTVTYNGDVGANTTNNPGNTWWIQQNFRHTNASNYWGTQVAWGWEDNANRLATRNITGGTFGNWVYYLNSSNYNSYAMAGAGLSANQNLNTSNAVTFTDIYASSWLRNNNSNTGLYNQANANHFYSRGGNRWGITGNGAASNIFLDFYATHENTIRGSIHADTSNNIGFLTPGGSWSFMVSSTGNATATLNVTAYSDERKKKNWRPVVDNFVEKLATIKSGIYERTDVEITQAGVSAQSFQALLPETVLEDKDGFLSVAYGNAALLSAVELAKEVVLLKEMVMELKAEINKLKE
jgi:hypothetical protein